MFFFLPSHYSHNAAFVNERETRPAVIYYFWSWFILMNALTCAGPYRFPPVYGNQADVSECLKNPGQRSSESSHLKQFLRSTAPDPLEASAFGAHWRFRKSVTVYPRSTPVLWRELQTPVQFVGIPEYWEVPCNRLGSHGGGRGWDGLTSTAKETFLWFLWLSGAE